MRNLLVVFDGHFYDEEISSCFIEEILEEVWVEDSSTTSRFAADCSLVESDVVGEDLREAPILL